MKRQRIVKLISKKAMVGNGCIILEMEKRSGRNEVSQEGN